jgi:hypothetical protein
MNEMQKENTDVYKCPFLDQCKFIQNNLEKMPELIQRSKERYCTQPEAECARRQLYETCRAEVVPPLMLPEQTAWARQIMEEYESKSLSDTQVSTIQ